MASIQRINGECGAPLSTFTAAWFPQRDVPRNTGEGVLLAEFAAARISTRVPVSRVHICPQFAYKTVWTGHTYCSTLSSRHAARYVTRIRERDCVTRSLCRVSTRAPVAVQRVTRVVVLVRLIFTSRACCVVAGACPCSARAHVHGARVLVVVKLRDISSTSRRLYV